MHIFVLHYSSNEQFQLCYIYTCIINERLVFSVLSTEASAFTAYLTTFPKKSEIYHFFQTFISNNVLIFVNDCPKRGAVLKKYKANCILFWLQEFKTLRFTLK